MKYSLWHLINEGFCQYYDYHFINITTMASVATLVGLTSCSHLNLDFVPSHMHIGA